MQSRLYGQIEFFAETFFRAVEAPLVLSRPYYDY